MKSEVMQSNGEYIKDALENGIDANATKETLSDALNKADNLNQTPKQVKEVIDVVVEMKSDVNDIANPSYASELVKGNSAKIKSALIDGITPEEVSKTLINNVEKANTKKSKRHLNFIVRLISKMKVKELKLQKEKTNEKGYQKVLEK